MPFRLNDQRVKVQFVTSADMPALIFKAAKATGICSNTVYIQHAVCEALSRDLGIPVASLLDRLPEPRTNAKALFGGDRKAVPAKKPQNV